MDCHYSTKENQITNGVYWVKIKLNNPIPRFDWALGVVRNGHFQWLQYYQFNGYGNMPDGGGIPMTPITLKELIELKVSMILIEKPPR